MMNTAGARNGIFNIEGGCYAKAINLSPKRSRTFSTRCVSALCSENVVLDEDRMVHYEHKSITQNTRGAYPIDFIHNARIPCIAGHPTDVIFLTCDAFGVLPPIASAFARPRDVSFHQRLHRESGRHRSRSDRAEPPPRPASADRSSSGIPPNTPNC